ncbi:hypothetical protein P3X46_005449 [Hevea brasiliensis]|uniref:Syntaxin 6 N-terminal domain-containing protein n=1 Tax=Hevea brasiliensis TaxID=3981 RepID=A0ABQ9N162_HEVBR|nr:uncharacterized protein LOC110662587 [Hevea brasiliensis]KAJ9185864.1 hypothetical protein P3X46_005449 [Hevea brasiliensis]
MSENSLFVDAWMREAQEVSRLVEDIESRIKNGHRLGDNAQSKLLEVGVKLDRLESLLHNPPSKPILTKEETKFRWEMLSDLRLRTRVLAFSLYTSPSTKRVGGSAVANAQGTNNPTKSDDQDHIKPSISKDDPEMLKPLISKDASQSRVQMKQSATCIPMSVLRKVCWIICLILGVAALIFLLVILCAAI